MGGTNRAIYEKPKMPDVAPTPKAPSVAPIPEAPAPVPSLPTISIEDTLSAERTRIQTMKRFYRNATRAAPSTSDPTTDLNNLLE